MVIGVNTPIFNEEYLLPLFLQHYKFADVITFFYDTDTTDKSLEVIEKYKKTDVEIIEYNSPGGFDDYYMIDLLNEKLEKDTVDYSICVDADEFIFHPNKHPYTYGGDIINTINECQCDYYLVGLYHMYPHETEDKEIRWDIPVWEQRKYGWLDNDYIKPCIIKKGLGLKYTIGKHFLYEYNENERINDLMGPDDVDFPGCHLNNINLDMAIDRRINLRKNRFSKRAIERGAGNQYRNLTKEHIILEFQEEYPKVW